MKINDNCGLYLEDLYYYDIPQCHYQILCRYGFDVSRINKKDKKQRNIQIGLMMRDNPQISRLLRTTTETTIDHYIAVNNVDRQEELILRAYDGIVVTRPLNNLNGALPIKLRKHYLVFITNLNRKMYIARTTDDETVVKGVSHRYPAMDKLYEELLSINYYDGHAVFKNLRQIQEKIYFGRDPWLYAIPKGNGKYSILLRKYGEVEIGETTIKILDTSDIDKEYYFEHYMWPFMESLVVEFTQYRR